MSALVRALVPTLIVVLLSALSGCACAREVTIDRMAPPEPGEQADERVAEPAQGESVVVLDTGNTLGIRPGGTAPSFTLDRPAKLESITTYHYIDGGGPAPGTIGLTADDGTAYGPWQAYGLEGQGGVANAFWRVDADVPLPVGTYTIVDSDPSTWSTNDTAEGVGFATVMVVYE